MATLFDEAARYLGIPLGKCDGRARRKLINSFYGCVRTSRGAWRTGFFLLNFSPEA
jgi:hypothetical protein